MNLRPERDAATHYEVRVRGHFDESWSPWFCGMVLSCEDDGTTILRAS